MADIFTPRLKIGNAQYHSGDKITSGVIAPETADPRLKQLYDANPYRNAEFTVSPWNQFLSWLGFRTSADSWKENMAIQASEYDSQVAQMDYQNDYNSPAAQSARMTAAGFNPNLNGGQSIDNGNSKGLPEDTSLPMVSQGDDVQVGNIIHSVLGVFSSAVGIVGSIQGVFRNRLDNNLRSIENESSLVGLAESVAGSFLPESPNPAGMLNDFDWKPSALRNAEKFAGRLPKSERDKFISYIENYWNSAIGESKTYDDFTKRVNSRRGFYMESQTNYDEFDSVLKLITEPLARLSADNIRSSLKRSNAENEAAIAGAETETEYQNALDGAIMGEAQNSENSLTKETNETIVPLRTALNDIVSNLERASKEDGLKGSLAQIALALLAGIQLNFAGGIHPTISRSESQSVSDSYGKTISHSGSHGGSTSIGF